MSLMDLDLRTDHVFDPDGPAYEHTLAFAEENRKAALNLLPGVVRRIADEIGFDVAFKLVHVYGGGEVWLPKTLTGRTGFVPRMRPLIGDDKILELLHLIGWGRLVVPSCKRFDQAFRRHLVRRSDAAGGSASAAARRAGIHVNSVYRDRRERRGAPAAT